MARVNKPVIQYNTLLISLTGKQIPENFTLLQYFLEHVVLKGFIANRKHHQIIELLRLPPFKMAKARKHESLARYRVQEEEPSHL